MIIVLTGAPGAGKGTQADLIQERLKFRKISTGDALRKHVSQGTEIGKKAEAIISEGRLVPNDVLLEVLKEEVGLNPDERILLDGYPRNLDQAEALKFLEEVHPVRGCVHLDVDRKLLIERLSGRRVCASCGRSFHLLSSPPKHDGVCDHCGSELTQRSDDHPEKVAVRLDVYKNETTPVLAFFQDKGLAHVVDGNLSQEDVYRQVETVIGKIS